MAKRENFRAAFAGFDIPGVARFGGRDVERLLQDAGIVRHRGRIEAVVNNARRAEELIDREGSLAAFVWRYEPDDTELPEPRTASTSPASIALSKDLRKQGWKFVGPTIAAAPTGLPTWVRRTQMNGRSRSRAPGGRPRN